MKTFRSILMTVVACILTACGGGGSSPVESFADDLNLVGTAAADVALSSAAVSVKCATGQSQTITSGDGSFSITLRSGGLPCMLEVSGSGRVYRSAVAGSGAGTYRVNANPLTELVVARIAGENGITPAALYSAFGSNNAAVTSTSLSAAVSYMRNALAGLLDLTGLNPLSDVLVAANGTTTANALGAKLSELQTKLSASNTTLDTLAAAISNGQSDPTPLAPKVTAQPLSASVVAAQPVTFSVVASSALPASYQWQKSTDGGATFVDVPGATGASYTVATPQMSDTGSLLRVRVSSAAGSLTSSAAALSVTAPAPTAPVIAVQPQNTSAPYGQGATFSVSATSSSTLSYQWRRNGSAIDGATEATYSVPMTVPGDHGASFSVVVTNSVGSTASAAAALTVTGIPVASPVRWAAGVSHSVVVRSDGTVLSWGNIKEDIGTSLSGLMGVGNDVVVPGAPTVAKNSGGSTFTGAQAVAASQWYTLVLKTDGTVWGWGYSGWGNLGHSAAFTFEQKSPVQVKQSDGSPLTSVIQVAAGIYSTSMAVTADGSVWSWGQNRYEHLGIGTFPDAGQPTAVPMLAPSGVGRFTDAIQVAPGISHTAVLKRDGTVFTVGWGDFGALGDGTTSNRTNVPSRVEIAPGVPLKNVVSIASGGNFSVAVTADGRAYAWGTNLYGNLGDGTRTTRTSPVLVRDASGSPMTGIVSAAAGIDFSVFLRSDGTVWAVGKNDIGQLGTNSTAASETIPAVVKDVGGAVFDDVVGIYLTTGHTLVRRSDGSLWTWGENTYLQVGDRTTVNRRNPVRVQ